MPFGREAILCNTYFAPDFGSASGFARLTLPVRCRYHAAGRLAGAPLQLAVSFCLREKKRTHADRESARPEGPQGSPGEDQDARARRLAAEPRRLPARLHDHPEEGELGPAECRR